MTNEDKHGKMRASHVALFLLITGLTLGFVGMWIVWSPGAAMLILGAVLTLIGGALVLAIISED
jgi:hypothetical protein